MIIDSSAILAILFAEKDADLFTNVLTYEESKKMSAATYLETAIGVDKRRNAVLSRRLDDMIFHARIIIEPVTLEHARIAREAYRDYGKGSGHKAQLNYGDCFAYALARASGEKLLFKGNDFKHTDIYPVL